MGTAWRYRGLHVTRACMRRKVYPRREASRRVFQGLCPEFSTRGGGRPLHHTKQRLRRQVRLLQTCGGRHILLA